MKYILLLVLISQWATVTAQDDFIISNVTLFDGTEIKNNISVFIKDGIIETIAPEIKGDYEVIDGSGKFLMPGMTNAHVHAFSPLSLVEAANAGVLNVLDMHGMEPMQEFMVSLRDSTNYARFFRAGYAATAPDGHGTQYGFPVPTLQKPEDVKQWVADRVASSVDHIKIIVEPWKNTLDSETVAAIIEEAHNANKVVVAHVSKEEDAYVTIKSGVDGLVHIYDDKSMSEDRLKELTENHNFFIIPTILTIREIQPLYYDKTAEETTIIEKALLKEVKRFYDAGIPILAGTDPPNANINMGTDLYKELVLFAKAGIPLLNVLKSATSLPADHFELENIGYIKEGFIADLLLLEKNPLEDINSLSTISTVWKCGKKVR